MSDSDGRRKAVFGIGLAVLVVWIGVVTLLGSGGESQGGGAGGRGVSQARVTGGRQPARGAKRSAAAESAVEFLGAYLRYEVGESSPQDRQSLARLATPRFGAQLLRSPVRAPLPAPSREWVSRVLGVRLGIFEGEQALLVSVFVVGPGGGHVLTPTLVERSSHWQIAGLGE